MTETTLLSDIRLLLQEALEPVRESIHAIELQLRDVKSASITREEFAAALHAEQYKREELEKVVIVLDKDVTAMKASMKVYVGIATGVAGIIGSGVGALIFSLLG